MNAVGSAGAAFVAMVRAIAFGLLATLAACAMPTLPDAPLQPALAQLATPYEDALRSVGITRMTSSAAKALVALDTYYGAVYVRYPAGVEPVDFTLDLGQGALSARAPVFDALRDARALAAVVPAAVRVTIGNNELGYARANPVN